MGKVPIILLIATSILIVYRDTAASVLQLWSHDGFRHCYLIPLVSVALIWLGRRELDPIPWKGSWLGLAILGLSLWCWLIGVSVAVQVVEQLALVLILNAAVWAILGVELYRKLAFPLLYLLLAVPVGDGSVPLLIEATADVSEAALKAAGIPVFRDGAYMTLPGGRFHIAESCSGFHYLSAGLAFGFLVGHFAFDSRLRYAGYVAVFAAICVLANGARAFIVMWVGSATEMEYLANDHIFFGWCLMAVIMFGMIHFARRISDKEVFSR